MVSYYLKYLKYKSKYLNLLNVLKGGEEIGRGLFGIVFRPPLHCEPRKEEFENDKYVGKIMTAEEAEKELINSNIVRGLDPSGEWSITVASICNFNKKQPQEPDFEKNKFQIEKDNFTIQLISKFGGKTIKKLISWNEDEPLKLDVSKIPLFIKLVKESVKAIDALNAGGYCHDDIHLDNIMYNEEDKKVRLIDFGKLKVKDESNQDFQLFFDDIKQVLRSNLVKKHEDFSKKFNKYTSTYPNTEQECKDAILSLPDLPE